MPQMRGVDDGAGYENPKGDTQRKKKAVRVRESAPIRHDGVRRRTDWPFLYYQEEGRTYFNPAQRATRNTKAEDIEEALF